MIATPAPLFFLRHSTPPRDGNATSRLSFWFTVRRRHLRSRAPRQSPVPHMRDGSRTSPLRGGGTSPARRRLRITIRLWLRMWPEHPAPEVRNRSWKLRPPTITELEAPATPSLTHSLIIRLTPHFRPAGAGRDSGTRAPSSHKQHRGLSDGHRRTGPDEIDTRPWPITRAGAAAAATRRQPARAAPVRRVRG